MAHIRTLVAALLAAIAVMVGAGTTTAAADEADLPSMPLWVYGHSYTTVPGFANTAGQELTPAFLGEGGI